MHSRLGTARRLAVVPAVAAILGLAAAAPAYAGKPCSGGTTSSGKCWVSPSTVAVGQDYTIYGSGLGAYTIVNVTVTDAAGISSYSLQADASGNTSLVTRSWNSGSDAVKFSASSGRKGSTVVASCGFTVA